MKTKKPFNRRAINVKKLGEFGFNTQNQIKAFELLKSRITETIPNGVGNDYQPTLLVKDVLHGKSNPNGVDNETLISLTQGKTPLFNITPVNGTEIPTDAILAPTQYYWQQDTVD